MKKHWSESGGNYPNMIKSRMKSVFVIIVVVVSFIIILFSFSSCTTQRDIEKVCASGICPTETITIHDTSYIETIDTVFQMSHWDSLLFASSWNPDKITDTIFIKDEFWKGQFIISKNDFKAKIEHLSDSITQIVKTVKTSSKTVEKQTIEVEKRVEVAKYNKLFYILLTWSILTIIFIVFVCIKKWQEMKFGWLKFRNKI